MQIDNPDELPYYVLEGERPVQVRFTPLESGDETYINDWGPTSVFFAMWQQAAQYDIARRTTLKLVAVEEQDNRILGLLRMGDDIQVRAIYGKLNTQSILETAPRLRYRVQEREYQGIGKVLVARLIAESVYKGHSGALIITPRPHVVGFYRHLGFRPLSRDPKRYFVQEKLGLQLLQSVLTGRENK